MLKEMFRKKTVVKTQHDLQVEAIEAGHFFPLITWERYYVVAENRMKNEPVITQDIDKISHDELAMAIDLLEKELKKKPF